MCTPVEVARRRELLLIDIRPLWERRSELGFLPASIALPLAGEPGEQLTQLEALGHTTGLVLSCASGRRSGQAWEALRGAASFPIHHLEGGQLAWEAAGLPVCRVARETADCPADVMAFRRHLIACFVAENTEVALDHRRAEVAPYQGLLACFQAAGVPWEQPTIEGLYRVLDRAGVATFQAGGDLRHIARNLSEMHALLGALERAAARPGDDASRPESTVPIPGPILR
jgi:rhodanese-related sulfurtransferase